MRTACTGPVPLASAAGSPPWRTRSPAPAADMSRQRGQPAPQQQDLLCIGAGIAGTVSRERSCGATATPVRISSPRPVHPVHHPSLVRFRSGVAREMHFRTNTPLATKAASDQDEEGSRPSGK